LRFPFLFPLYRLCSDPEFSLFFTEIPAQTKEITELTASFPIDVVNSICGLYFRSAVNAQQPDHVRCGKDAEGRTVTRQPTITLK